MAGQSVRVRREVLEACMTCPICHKLLREATTISVCLHTFCNKCITDKISDEDLDSCPVCNEELGCIPMDKLRPDPNLQEIRSKIFPLKRREVKAQEFTPSITLPVKRKERSLSSLVVDTPKIPSQTGLTGRRTKAVARRAAALRSCSFAAEDSTKRGDSSEDQSFSSTSPRSHAKTVKSKVQGSSGAEPSSGQKAKKEMNSIAMEGKTDLWTPLNCLVEVAKRNKTSSKSYMNGPKLESRSLTESQLHSESKTGADHPAGQAQKSRMKDAEGTRVKLVSNGTPVLGGPIKRRRMRGAEMSAASAQVMLDASGIAWNMRNTPIWFSLVASEDGEGDVSLPQISACYLRIKDGNMPVSHIQKYIGKKLDLGSETEVEISCRGQPVLPTLELQDLVDLWFRTASTTKKVPASVGSSAKDFVMVLSYCRKL